MLKDRMVIWVMEYIFGAILILVPLALLGLWRPIWMDACVSVVGLFVVCLGVILTSCASSMRQRLLLGRRIDKLAESLGA